MLMKLLKYDLKYMIKNMGIFYILSIFFAITTRILFNMDQSAIIKILGQISVGCMFSMIASTLINTMMRSWVRFRDSLYKDEAYLTHTLPVTKNDLYNSKFIQTLIFFIIGFVIIIVSLFITYYSKENWTAITNYVRTITTGLNMSTAFFITMFFMYSVLFGFIIYLVAQTIILGLVFVYGLFDPSVMQLFETATINVDVNAFKTLAVLSSLLYLLIICVMSVLCKKTLSKGVNIE